MTTTANEAIASYISDMLALQKHIEKAINGQIADLDDEPKMVEELRRVAMTCQRHISTLESLAERHEDTGASVAKAVKSVASSMLGFGAAAVDFVRSEKLPKNLRDDYTAVQFLAF